MKKLFALLSLGLIVLFGSFFWYEQTNAPVMSLGEEITLESPDGEKAVFSVEIADDDTERATGLMFRQHVEPGTGMLFVFDHDMPLSFWMKNTLVPLDILFFDSNFSFVSRTSMTPCEADPCASYPSEKPAKYALEVAAGEPLAEKFTLGSKLHLADTTGP